MTARKARGGGTARAPQWRKKAVPVWVAPGRTACLGEDTSLFYKGEQERPGERLVRVRKAKRLCQACPFREACLESAMDEERHGGGRYGIRGGLTEEERNERKRAEGKAGEAA